MTYLHTSKKNLANSQNTFEQTKNFMAKLFGREKTKIQIFTPSSWKCKLLVSKSETPLICANLMTAVEMKSQVAWHDNVELFSEMCSLISWAVTTAV